MQINLTKKEQLTTTTWQGGTTTQLAIYPENAIYKNLDFIFRISTATVEAEESTFTSLPNVNRVIMVLNGELTIQHKNQYSKHLKKFDADNFSGNWETTSLGKVTDFNVMTRGLVKATTLGFSLIAASQKECIINGDFFVVYVSQGDIIIEPSSAQKINLKQGDVAFMRKEKVNEKFNIVAKQLTDIALAEIYL